MHLTSQAPGMAAAWPSTSRKGAINLHSDANPNDEDFDRIDDLFDEAVLPDSVDKDEDMTSNADAGRKTPTTAENDGDNVKTGLKEPNNPQKFPLYVGPFSWWTSDEDVLSVAQRLDVRDIEEIKFAENKANGQSRGYAKLVVTSGRSAKILLDKIPQCTMDGEKIDCRLATQQNLTVFEYVANKRFPMRSNSRDCDSLENTPLPRNNNPPRSIPTHFPPHPLGNIFPSHSSPFLGQPPPPFPPVPPNILPPPLFPPQLFNAPRQPSPSLHINPAYISPPPERHSRLSYNMQKGDRDYEELLNRNRAVASSAITKAVTGATTGDLRVAMETLLTAIAIIKQSRIYGDKRCQALVTSLKDCLVSIQGDSGHSRSSSHSDTRVRDRERHREELPSWEGAGTSRRHRERSRSRERERERLRDRHRDQRDRYR
ncbi:cleavage and polyadenylation specificity factor subunit 7-like isoform X1 [Nerophis lumbriciformis]|uniref:cleavage and polyadenylation specificity factor subunit 7-like isoform X1 n=1 Tax=Nerophis lumbriciformis TaxID=546530 RepID=UPI002AE05567|nr:cleavage and polyadenylation specificity factor subunit 7-like isoform X1 [Nerophis lumbriciformis]